MNPSTQGGPGPILRASLLDTPSTSLTQAWVRRYSTEQQASNDMPEAIAVDRAGNVFVAGVSDATFSGGDYVLVKYTSQGAALWTARYHDDPGSFNEPTALAVDSSGNSFITGYSERPSGHSKYVTVKFDRDGVRKWVTAQGSGSDSAGVATSIVLDPGGFLYVTGFSYASGTDMDYVTVKYNASGAEQWTARYDGPVHGVDIATGLGLDSSGNVYVTGYSAGEGTGYDYATVSYDAQGRERWRARFNSPTGGDDFAEGLAVDRAGNAVVTGSSAVPGAGYDYLTVKYTSMGASLWTARYNGPASGDDQASVVVCDRAGNVYVTGGSAGNGTGEDFATIKYSAGGALRWAARYNDRLNGPDRAIGLAVGRGGGVFVTGTSRYSTSFYDDFATVIYDSGGTVLSSSLYNGITSREDAPVGIALDANDNAYVTGISDGNGADIATVKYVSGRIDNWPALYASGAGGDRMTGVAADREGNVYATGWNSHDIRTAGFDPVGNRRWLNVYNALPNPVATAFTLDGEGNVYVGGYATGASGLQEMLVVTYDTSGILRWATHFKSPGGVGCRVAAIAVDAQHNAYVTGPSAGASSGSDYLTVRINPGGDTAWTARYNGAANNTDIPAAIAVDGAGNVYVTGSSIRSESSNDYATLKYSQAGVQQWVAYYNGTGGGSDFASAIALDADGDVYVTGRSYGRNTSVDFATIRYTPAGDIRWAARFNGPGNAVDAATAIAVDGRKNVVVAGYTFEDQSSLDYATLKYDSAGSLQWTAFYDGTANGPDYPVGLALDQTGNIFVSGTTSGAGTGDDMTTVEYDANGVQQQVLTFNDQSNFDDEAAAVALDSSGSVFVAGTVPVDSVQGYGIVKYASTGAPHWPVRYDGPGVSFDVVNAMAVDSLGNVFITGGSYSQNTSMDMVTMKYSTKGVLEWSARFETIGQTYEEGRAIALDRAGNICVTGLGFNLLGVTDYITVRYAPDGAELFHLVYNHFGNSYNFPKAIGVDNFLNIYVTGTSWNGHDYDITTVAYDTTAKAIWGGAGISFDGSSGGDDIASGLVVDSHSNVYVTGYTHGSYLDYATVKYDASGAERWRATYDGPAGGDDRAVGIALDSSGNVFVTGTSLDSSYSFNEIATVAYSPQGKKKWAARYGTGFRSSAEAVAVEADRSGNVYVTGNSYDSTYTWSDFVTIKYDTSGIAQWVSLYDGIGHADDLPSSLRIDWNGNIYVGGASMNPGLTYDYTVVRYTPDGHLSWTARYKELANSDDRVKALGLDGGGNVYAAGVSSEYQWQVVNTLKYSQGTLGVSGSSIAVPSGFRLYQNYPNPFNPTTTIGYSLPNRSHVLVCVYDILGREVARLTDGIEEAGVHTVRFEAGGLSSGVYVCRVLGSGGFESARKMLLLR